LAFKTSAVINMVSPCSTRLYTHVSHGLTEKAGQTRF
jgi:hypothetical protein